jgi:hypothetical protein
MHSFAFILVQLVTVVESLFLNGSVTSGHLFLEGIDKGEINNTFSALNSVIQLYWASLPLPVNDTVLANANTSFSFLELRNGVFVADESLSLPSNFILSLENVDISPSSTFLPYRSMIEINSTFLNGIVSRGGPSMARFRCDNVTISPGVVTATNSSRVYVDGLDIFGCGHGNGGAIHFQGIPMTWGGFTATGLTVSNCNIRNSSRAIWTETVSGVSVHNNSLSFSTSHTLDFDAFTHYSVATGNIIFNNSAREGVFIEQGAIGITISNNVIGPGNGNGIAVYNNDMNITCGPHVIAGNQIFNNLNAGVSIGSTAPKAGSPNMGVLVMGNQIFGNGGEKKPQGYHTNGAQIGTIYASNNNLDGISKFTQFEPFSSQNISIIDPINREKPLKV